uniref:Uncharacterized protein n=1 Tax=Arundo donax TaxID=35708 RepID=A0A0A9EN32_ARUDO
MLVYSSFHLSISLFYVLLNCLYNDIGVFDLTSIDY